MEPSASSWTKWVAAYLGRASAWKGMDRKLHYGFPGGAVVKNPPANVGDTGSSSGPGRSHMLWSN